MEKNKLIIIVLLVVIAVLLAGILVSMPNYAKADSQLEIIGNDTLNEEDNYQIKLTDVNGTALSNQTVKITFTDKDNSTSDYSVVTNDEGVGEIKLDKNAGEYDITVSYGGNDNYKGCNSNKTIEIKEKEVQAQTTSSSSSSLPYSLYNLPPSNDPYPETSREQVDEYTVMQKYDDGYISYVDLRTGKRSSGGFYK